MFKIIALGCSLLCVHAQAMEKSPKIQDRSNDTFVIMTSDNQRVPMEQTLMKQSQTLRNLLDEVSSADSTGTVSVPLVSRDMLLLFIQLARLVETNAQEEQFNALIASLPLSTCAQLMNALNYLESNTLLTKVVSIFSKRLNVLKFDDSPELRKEIEHCEALLVDDLKRVIKTNFVFAHNNLSVLCWNALGSINLSGDTFKRDREGKFLLFGRVFQKDYVLYEQGNDSLKALFIIDQSGVTPRFSPNGQFFCYDERRGPKKFLQVRELATQKEVSIPCPNDFGPYDPITYEFSNDSTHVIIESKSEDEFGTLTRRRDAYDVKTGQKNEQHTKLHVFYDTRIDVMCYTLRNETHRLPNLNHLQTTEDCAFFFEDESHLVKLTHTPHLLKRITFPTVQVPNGKKLGFVVTPQSKKVLRVTFDTQTQHARVAVTAFDITDEDNPKQIFAHESIIEFALSRCDMLAFLDDERLFIVHPMSNTVKSIALPTDDVVVSKELFGQEASELQLFSDEDIFPLIAKEHIFIIDPKNSRIKRIAKPAGSHPTINYSDVKNDRLIVDFEFIAYLYYNLRGEEALKAFALPGTLNPFLGDWVKTNIKDRPSNEFWNMDFDTVLSCTLPQLLMAVKVLKKPLLLEDPYYGNLHDALPSLIQSRLKDNQPLSALLKE